MRIDQLKHFSELGKRNVNQDSFLVTQNKENTEWFLGVYDGVGGDSHGEIASRLAADSTRQYLEQQKWPAAAPGFYAGLYKFIDAQFVSAVSALPEKRQMSTTAVTVYLKKTGAYIHSIGDSRLFVFRKGKIIYESRPDSLVYEMYEQGNLTREEMANHRMKNMITKAVQSGNPTPEKKIDMISDLRAGDIFLLCSDGVLEANAETDLARISAVSSLYTLYDMILANCRQQSKDNYTAILFSIAEGARRRWAFWGRK